MISTAFVVFALCQATLARAEEPATVTTNVETDSVESLLEKMSLKQKIGQLFIFGFSGTTAKSSLNKVIDIYQPGAIIIFGHNISSLHQISTLNYDAQQAAQSKFPIPLMIMVDQEGGSVARIKTRPAMPSALSLGRYGHLETVQDMGRIGGSILGTLGFNVDLAPVFDLSNPNLKNFIGNRAFGGDPDSVADLAIAFSKGLTSAGILSTAKHFPGHGGLVQDSHRRTPEKLSSYAELAKSDLIPFKRFAEVDSFSAVMVAHIAFPNIDKSGMPAAFSRILISDVLRTKLKYDGLVITDDIEMIGARQAGSIADRTVRAIDAGCDMVMVAWSPRRRLEAFNSIAKAVKSGRLSEARINESVRRILKQKLRLKSISRPQAPTADELRADLSHQFDDLRDITRKINESNFKNSAGAYPDQQQSITSEPHVFVFSADKDFYQSFISKISNPSTLVSLSHRSLAQIKTLMESEPDSLAVFYATGTVSARGADALPESLKSRMVVINASYPGIFSGSAQFRALVQLSSQDPKAGEWTADYFFREATENRLPSSTPPAL